MPASFLALSATFLVYCSGSILYMFCILSLCGSVYLNTLLYTFFLSFTKSLIALYMPASFSSNERKAAVSFSIALFTKFLLSSTVILNFSGTFIPSSAFKNLCSSILIASIKFSVSPLISLNMALPLSKFL